MGAELLERVLLVGGSGQIGSELRTVLEPLSALLVPTRAQLDISIADTAGAAIVSFSPTLVVNTAAFHNTQECERDVDRAFTVNAVAVDRLAAACVEAGAAFATFSTDYVFDGLSRRPYREDDPANPINAYGVSKLAGEHLVRRYGHRHFIIRTSGVYGRTGHSNKGPTFIERMLAQASEGAPLRVVDDVTFSPSLARDVALGFVRIVTGAGFGTYHLTNTGSTTWFEFAKEGLRLAGIPAAVEPISAESIAGKVRRPANSALENAAMSAQGIALAPSWEDGLRRYIEGRRDRALVATGSENA